MRALVILGVILALSAGLAVAEGEGRWEIAYSHRDGRSSLLLTEIQFADATHGIALGGLAGPEERPPVPVLGKQVEPVFVVTADGGASWSLVPLKTHPRSLFYLDAENCWVTTGDGLWKSVDGGGTLRKISGRSLGRLHFLTPRHGFALGLASRSTFEPEAANLHLPAPTRGSYWIHPPVELSPRTGQVLESWDGGATWKTHPVSKQFGGAAAVRIDFVGPRGTVTGDVLPARSAAQSRPMYPHPSETILAETADAGKTWTVKQCILPGVIRDYRLAPDGAGYALVWTIRLGLPTALYKKEAGRPAPMLVYSHEDLTLTGLAVREDGSVWLAAVRYPPYGAAGEVWILRSVTGSSFRRMTVDPRVRANSVKLTAAPGGAMWAATDTGFVLRLRED